MLHVLDRNKPFVACFYSLFIIQMKNTILIGSDRYTQNNKIERHSNRKTDIFDLYERPSSTKVAIFREWQEKLYTIDGLIGNSSVFSIYWTVKDGDGHLHHVKITPSYNYILD